MKKQILLLGFVLSAFVLNGQIYKTIQVINPGTLSDLLTSDEKTTVTHLTVTGIIDSLDFITMRDHMPAVCFLDLSGSSTVNNALYQLALSYKNLLESVLLPHSITRIGQEALMYTSITEISIPPTVTLIEHAPFRYCPLKQITIPASVKSIGSTVFSPCDSLKAIYVEEGNTAYCGIDGVLFSSDTMVLVACPPARKGNYFIPSSVREIDYEGFASCQWIDTLFIPASVSKTGKFSFSSCTSLKDFQVEESSTFLTDADGVLYTKDLSTLIRYPISKRDTSYDVLFGTKIIGTGSFQNCKILTRISFPITLNRIESSAFRYAENITSMELPPSVETIENAAFFYCRSMKRIRIPSSVSTIEPLFLNGAEALDTIVVNSSEPVVLFPWSTYFNRVDTNACILMVPSGSYSAYRNSIRWNSFAHITEYNTSLEVSPTEFNIEAAGGKTAFFSITSNTEWRIKSLEQWLQFSDTLGMNNKIVTITADPNTGSGYRQAIADLMPLEKETISLYITQEGLPTNDDGLVDKKSGLYYNASQKFIVAEGMLNQTLSVYTVDGRLIVSYYISEDTNTVFVGNLPEGIYIVKASAETLKILIKD